MAPQSNHVLLCANCKTFQVHIVKKSSKWECKICGSKQTVQKVFGEGTGADCRQIVGKLNIAKGLFEEELQLNRAIANHNRELEEQQSERSESTVEENSSGSHQRSQNKWAVFGNTDNQNRLD